MRFQDILMMTAQASGGATWTPLNLGASLLAWWDAERADLITLSGSTVSSWKDIIGGYDLTQAAGASKPAYSATLFNNRPCVSPDGTDDYLELAGGFSGLPAVAAASEDWYLVDQIDLAAVTTTRELGSWGSTANSNSRRSNRTVVTGVNRATSLIGAVSVNNANVDFSGRHVVRVITSGTTLQVDVDGVAGTPSATVPATIASRLRMFANSPVTPTVFGYCRLNTRLIMGAVLSAGQATSLYGFLNGRI